MALTDYSATSGAAPFASLGRILSRLVPVSRRRESAAEVTQASAKARPAHEANYLADIGMEIGF